MGDQAVNGYQPQMGLNGHLEATKLLSLRVISGHNLARKDIFGASDPYVRIDLVRGEGDGEEVIDAVLTKTKRRTLNPEWNQEFLFRVKPAEHRLVLEVYDENRLTRDDFLGRIELPLATLPRQRPGRSIPEKNYVLRPRSARSHVRGHLRLFHAYVPDPSGLPDDDESLEEPSEPGPDWEVLDAEGDGPDGANVQVCTDMAQL
ncbi:E3 ubiquitin-protein ligase Nedd-4-like [Pollicipes pollicipes]|uniref:E3 ubiquitin-protein ligase Nedd-4-like n=1 Tax=Pollicipes pollicipes TaxID=41117 RepID=UPI0018852A38|nr:E3 ubiquitin-protein ligase Nedd-4-like [Pollicipes pollicipes]